MSEPKQTDLQIVAPEGASPLALIGKLIDQGALTTEAVDVVERLVRLQEHILDKNAEQAFAAGFAALQADLAPVQATSVTVPFAGQRGACLMDLPS